MRFNMPSKTYQILENSNDPREVRRVGKGERTMANLDFTAREFLDWVKTKPRDEKYNYLSPERCAMAQFLKETGRSDDPNVGPDDWRGFDGCYRMIPDPPRYILNKSTFGELADAVENKLSSNS
jgi:hypothetical protein